MPEWLSGNEWAAWLALALILGVVEAATADLIFLMLAGGALAAALVAVGFPFGAQVIVAVVVSIGLLGVVRPIAKRHLSKTANHSPIGTARYIDKIGTAVEAIDEHSGLLVIEGDTWTARIAPGDSPIPVDAPARITAVHGALLVVTAAAPIQDVRRPQLDAQ